MLYQTLNNKQAEDTKLMQQVSALEIEAVHGGIGSGNGQEVPDAVLAQRYMADGAGSGGVIPPAK